MNTKNFKLTILIALCGILSNAQNTNAFQGNDLLNTNDVIRSIGNRGDNNGASVKAVGSAYIDESFLPLKIKGYDGQTFTGRYNALNAKMEVTVTDKVIALDNRRDFEVTFLRDNKTYRTFNFETPEGYNKAQFLVVVNEGENYALLKEERVRFQDMVPASTPYASDQPAKFVRQPDRYYAKIGENITFIPKGKKGIYKAFPEHAKALKSFAKKEKLSPKDENDLGKMIAYLTTL